MTLAADVRSGKDHRGENFPVASRLISTRHRKAIRAFYDFVRVADDVADHATLSEGEKLKLLDSLEATLLGRSNAEPEGVALREVMAERSLDPQHARDLITAFRMDVTKHRYANWDELMNYCRYSAMPVGRFVLDVHGEPRTAWPANDALCAGLQIINHMQDCGKDYRNLDRVYLPLDLLEVHGACVEDLQAPAASPQLRACLDDLCARVAGMLQQSAVFPEQIGDRGLSLEVAVIQRLAERLTRTLQAHDPLSERVHLGKLEVASLAVLGLLRGASRRFAGNGKAAVDPAANGAVNSAAAASGSSFYAAMRILPRAQRQAMFDVYAFCRAVDDVADEAGDRAERLARLEQWRRDIDDIYAGKAPAPLASLAQTVRDYGLARDDFLAVIDGMEMDVRGDIRAPDLATLDLYCDRVASAVGRLCVRIFGVVKDDGIALAYHLGRALQLTNTLRDLDEDAGIGRLYLPRDFLLREGIDSTDPQTVLAHPALGRACASVAALAEGYFVNADKIMAKSPRAVVRAPRIMAEAYRRILNRLIARGWRTPRAPVKLGKGQIAQILIRSFVK